MAENLLIVGASARAAAFSALRAGLTPWCVDLFADADLAARCAAERLAVADYPHGFARRVAHELTGPWMYTGSLEHWPDLVGIMARQRPLWGNDAAQLVQARLPDQVTAAWRGSGLACPDVCAPESADTARRYLIKPILGGPQPRFWHGRLVRPIGGRPVYLQEFIEGAPCAAIFVGTEQDSVCLGVSRQLVGQPWLRAAPFCYCGSIGPLTLSEAVGSVFARIGASLTSGCYLRGLFGVDCILRDSVPYPVEVNPRYTASVEVLEYASGTPLLALHRAVFDPTSKMLAFRAPPALSELVGKAILFAKDDLTFPPDGPWMPTLRHPGDIWEMPAFADIPHAGEPIEKGKPILTFFARGPTEEAVLATLQATAADLERWLFTS